MSKRRRFRPFHLDRFGGRMRESVEDEVRSHLETRIGQLIERGMFREGKHPELGTVTLRQLLVTWVCHDFSHLGQIYRVLAKRHGEAVGTWARYLSILHR